MNTQLKIPNHVAFIMDGTHTAISHFDLLKNDEGYAS